MLTGAVNAGERFFVKQANQVVLCGAFFHDHHNQLVGITGVAGIGEDGGKFMLTRSAFIVLGLYQRCHYEGMAWRSQKFYSESYLATGR